MELIKTIEAHFERYPFTKKHLTGGLLVEALNVIEMLRNAVESGDKEIDELETLNTELYDAVVALYNDGDGDYTDEAKVFYPALIEKYRNIIDG